MTSFLINVVYGLGIRSIFALGSLVAVVWSCWPDGWQPGFYNFIRYCLRALLAATFTTVKVDDNAAGAEPCLYVTDRPRRLAAIYLIAYWPRRVRIIVMSEVLDYLFIGRVLRGLGCISYPQHDDDKQAAWLFAGALSAALRGGESVLLFTENISGRSRKSREQGRRLVEIARLCGVPIVPLFTTLTGAGNGNNRDLFLRGEVTVRAGAAISPAETTDSGEIAARIVKMYNL